MTRSVFRIFLTTQVLAMGWQGPSLAFTGFNLFFPPLLLRCSSDWKRHLHQLSIYTWLSHSRFRKQTWSAERRPASAVREWAHHDQ